MIMPKEISIKLLTQLLEHFKKLNLFPVIGAELEFYLLPSDNNNFSSSWQAQELQLDIKVEREKGRNQFEVKTDYSLNVPAQIQKIEDFKEDMKNILLMMDVLEDDYLGGHGTRGYGRIKFKNLSFELKTYTEENKKELITVEKEIKEINNFRKELESKVE